MKKANQKNNEYNKTIENVIIDYEKRNNKT